MIEDYLPDFVSTLRNVNRVVPVFVFYLEHYIKQTGSQSNNNGGDKTQRSLEVNPGDLLALELLRFFDTEVHNRIPACKSILSNWGQAPSLASDIKKEVLERLLAPLERDETNSPPEWDPARDDRAKDMLFFLFPHLREDAEFVLGTENDQYRRRVSHPEMFDRYFERRIPDSALLKGQIEALLDAAQREDEVGNLFSDLVSQSDSRRVISALDSRLDVLRRGDELSRTQIQSLLTTLFDEGDELKSFSTAGFEMPESELAVGLIQTLLRQYLSSVEERGAVLLNALTSTSGLYLPARVVQGAIRENRRRLKYRPPLYKISDLDQAVSVFAKKVEDAATSGDLTEQRHMQRIFHAWHRYGFRDEALDWIEDESTKSTEGFFRCLEAFNVASSRDQMIQTYHQSEEEGAPFSLDGEYLNSLGLLEIFADAKKQVDTNDLSQRQHRMIAELRRVNEAIIKQK